MKTWKKTWLKIIQIFKTIKQIEISISPKIKTAAISYKWKLNYKLVKNMFKSSKSNMVLSKLHCFQSRMKYLTTIRKRTKVLSQHCKYSHQEAPMTTKTKTSTPWKRISCWPLSLWSVPHHIGIKSQSATFMALEGRVNNWEIQSMRYPPRIPWWATTMDSLLAFSIQCHLQFVGSLLGVRHGRWIGKTCCF